MKNLKFALDNWQKEVLNHKGNIVVCSGRQVGKSTVIGRKAAEFALNNKNVTVVIGAAIERQAGLIFWMVKDYLRDNYKSKIKGKMTLHFVELRNGSKIFCVPIGESGLGIRGLTANMLIIDEAAFVKERAWRGITPLLATTNGPMILLSTPFGNEGFFIECLKDDNFKSWHLSSEDCPRISKEFLERERRRLGKMAYAQEYLGQPLGELKQFFSTDLIKECMTLPKDFVMPSYGDAFLGVDVARMGEDETVLFSLRRRKENMFQIEMQIFKKIPVTETANNIKEADKNHNFKKIYIDTGGVGGGVYDILRDNEDTRRKVVEINNASRATDYDPDREQRIKIMKENLYNNLKNLMEGGKIKLFMNQDTDDSLRCIQYEYTDEKRMKLFGKYDHIVEALVRAAWCMRDKSLNIYIY